MNGWLLMGDWTTCGFSELTQLKMTLTPPAKLTWTLPTHVLVAFHTPVTTPTSLHSFKLYPFLVCISVSKAHSPWSILILDTAWQGLAFISNILGFAAPTHFMFVVGFGLPIFLVHLFGQQCACLWVVRFLAWDRLSKQCKRFTWASCTAQSEAFVLWGGSSRWKSGWHMAL